NSQLAPPFYLAVEGLLARLFGSHGLVLRFFSLACGVAALFLFLAAARRVLRPGAVCVALALFAVSEDLIYYSTELKQYMADVVAALVCLLVGLELRSGPLDRARALGAGIIGALVVWFSHASAFVLAAVGGSLVIAALLDRAWKRAVVL